MLAAFTRGSWNAVYWLHSRPCTPDQAISSKILLEGWVGKGVHHEHHYPNPSLYLS
jgi:hypothetical protein